MKKLRDAMHLPEMSEMREWILRNGILESGQQDDENDALPNEAAQMDHPDEDSAPSKNMQDDVDDL